MDAAKFLKEMKRMCKFYESCDECSLKNNQFNTCLPSPAGIILDFVPDMVNAVEKWSKEHPQKTKLDDLKEKFPKSHFALYGAYPNSPPVLYGYCKKLECIGCEFETNRITQCWDTPLEVNE